MADNVAITAGSGTTIAADDIGGVLHQRVKISQGADGAATDVSASAPLQVSLANTGANATPVVVDLGANNDVTVTGTVAVTDNSGSLTVDNPQLSVVGGGLEATALRVTLASDSTGVVSVDDNGGSLTIDGTVTINAIPAGTNNIGDVDVLTINGVAPAFGTGVRGATVQRVTIATDDSVPVTGTFWQATQPVSGTVTANAGTGTMAVSMATNTPLGTVAHDSADSGAPIKTGGRARTSDITSVANDDRVDAIFDKSGRQVIFPYCLPENLVSGAITTAMTGTTSTSLIAAPGAGLYNYITQVTVSNAHATVGTDVTLQDGSGGTAFYTIPAAAVYGGAAIQFNPPLRQPTSNTALYCVNITTGASTKVSASGFKGA